MVRRLNLYRFCLRIICYGLPLVAFACAAYMRALLRWHYQPIPVRSAAYIYLVILVTLVWAAMAECYQLVSPEELLIRRTGATNVLRAVLATFFIVLIALFFCHENTVSRTFLPGATAVLAVLGMVTQGVFRNTIRTQLGISRPIRVMVIGADNFARRAARRLVRSAEWFRVVGFVRIPGQEATKLQAPVYDLETLHELQLGHGIDDVLIAVPPDRLNALPQILAVTKKFCAPVRVVMDLGKGVVVRERLVRFGQLHVLDLADGSMDELPYVLLKRAFDIAFSLLAIVITGPLMLVITAAIWLTSRGPILFVQERVGLNGQTFRMYKFRTMAVTSSTESDTRWTTANDPRRTRLGTFLRRSSLDELPQFFNVLQGGMSVVGPRPERPHFVRKFVQDVGAYHSRHRLKVGITGWAQVNGLRGDTSISKRIEYDLYYLQNWSFVFDLRIIFLTVWAGFFGPNAY